MIGLPPGELDVLFCYFSTAWSNVNLFGLSLQTPLFPGEAPINAPEEGLKSRCTCPGQVSQGLTGMPLVP